jgi:hypothetical protein
MHTQCPVATLAREYADLLAGMTLENEDAVDVRLREIRADVSHLLPVSPEGVNFLLFCIEVAVCAELDGEHYRPVLRMLAALAPQGITLSAMSPSCSSAVARVVRE